MAIHVHVIRTRYPHWGAYSGINQFVKYLNRGKYNVDMQVVSDSDEDFPLRNRVIRTWLRAAVQKRGMKWYKLSDFVAEMKAFQKCRRKHVDILHYLDGEHSVQFLPGLSKLLGRARPKMVAMYHQPPEVLDSLIIKDIIPRLDGVLVVSPEQVSYFRELVEPEKIRLILHGIDTDYFKPGNFPREERKFKCLTVGHYLRDFKVIREVAEKLSCCGEGIEFHMVSSQAGEVQGLPNVTVYSGIDDAKLLTLYQQSDLLFLPLVQSTANNALLEGIACGLPVVSTDLPSIKAYLPGKEAILIKDNDPKQFVDTILHLLHNPVERQIMGQEARKRAQELDWRVIASQYDAVYSDLVNSHASL